jgi:hypothetical protein
MVVWKRCDPVAEIPPALLSQWRVLRHIRSIHDFALRDGNRIVGLVNNVQSQPDGPYRVIEYARFSLPGSSSGLAAGARRLRRERHHETMAEIAISNPVATIAHPPSNQGLDYTSWCEFAVCAAPTPMKALPMTASIPPTASRWNWIPQSKV